MTIYVVAVHILLATVLFFTMNWIGGHAVVTAAYYQVSYFSRYDDAPAFNVLFRVLTPVVFIVLAGAGLYAVGLPSFVVGMYAVVIYQQLLRWGYIVVMNRWRLTKWRVQFAIAVVTWSLAWVAYRTILIDPQRLLPDLDNLTNELWLLIIIFLYKLFDNVYATADGNRSRKEDYLRTRYRVLAQRFGRVINDAVPDVRLHPLVFAVLIYETFNRPPFLQLLERLIPSSGPRTYGPMQVRAGRPITDEESVRRGAQLLVEAFDSAYSESRKAFTSDYGAMYDEAREPRWVRRNAAEAALRTYNIRSDYPSEVMAIHEFLVDEFYEESSEELVGLG